MESGTIQQACLQIVIKYKKGVQRCVKYMWITQELKLNKKKKKKGMKTDFQRESNLVQLNFH